jgi:hypothetical protein
MKTRACNKCGKPIAFVLSRKSGKTAAVDVSPEGRYVPVADAGRGDPDEPRCEYRRVYRPHQETCAALKGASL